MQLVHNSWIPITRENSCGCGADCIWQADFTTGTKLELVIIMTHMHTKPERQFPEQVLAFLELEPPIHGSFGADARTAKSKGYDWKMTYERDSDVQMSYAPTKFRFGLFNNTEQRTDYLALLMVSNCKDGDRLQYASELMKFIPILSMGKCLNNMPNNSTPLTMFPRCKEYIEKGDRLEMKLCFMSHFRYNLAFENSRYDDYVTEKLFDSFNTPSLAIYRGSPTVKQLLPALHSAIMADDFASPRALADYLMLLENNTHLYDEYSAWKQLYLAGAPLLPAFQRLQEYNMDSFQCNVCRKLLSHLAHYSPPPLMANGTNLNASVANSTSLAGHRHLRG